MTERPTKLTADPTAVELLDEDKTTRPQSKLRQHAGEWVSAALSLLLLILTITYASRCIGVSRYQSIGSSRSRTILVLRVLSELTTTMLGLTLALTMERVQWHQIVLERGQPFLSFLGLAPGTSIFGLAKLVFVKGPCMASWRLWSLSRLILLAILPILNVVIFGKYQDTSGGWWDTAYEEAGNVQTRLTYHSELTKSGAFNMGMGEFNVSSAQVLAQTQIADSIIGMDFQDFLSDPRIAVDITPSPEDVVPCTLGISRSSKQTCNQVFYMPGTYGDLDLLKNGTLPYADLVVVHDTRGYQLDFNTIAGDNKIEFDIDKACGVYGTDIYAFQLCFKDYESGIAMQVNSCMNMTNISQSRCLHDTKWRRQSGFASTLKIGARKGTVAFSRLNSSIQTYELANDVQSTNITAAQLLAAFEGFFTGTSSEGNEPTDEIPSEWTAILSSLMEGSSGQAQMGPRFVAVYFAIGSLMYGSQNVAARNAIGLYSLVAKILWWCSTSITKSIPARGASTSLMSANLTDTIETGFGDHGQATYSLATSRYELIVDPATIIAYSVLGGFVLLLCVAALFLSTVFTSATRQPPVMTAFPDINHRQLNIENLEHVPMDEWGNLEDRRLQEGHVTLLK